MKNALGHAKTDESLFRAISANLRKPYKKYLYSYVKRQPDYIAYKQREYQKLVENMDFSDVEKDDNAGDSWESFIHGN